MKTKKSFLGFIIMTLLPVSLLLGCEGPANNALTRQTRIHSVETKNKMSLLLKEASAASERSSGWFINDGEQTPNAEDYGSGERDYVDTNEQVEGVKEGDIVKTDGYDIYYAPRYHNVIRVMEVDNNYDVSLATTIELHDTYIDALYLLDDYLVVVGYSYEQYDSDYIDEEYISCRWWSPTGTVLVIERQNYETVYKMVLDSYFMDHRIIEDSLFLVSHKYLYYGDVDYEYRPTYKIIRGENATTEYLSYESIYYFDDNPAYGINVITGIKLSSNPNNIQYNASGYLGALSYYKNLYVNSSDMYVVESTYHYTENSYYTTSTISQFSLDIDNAKSEYVAAVIVAGVTLNQFSMDVYDGYLRIATTDRKTTWNSIDLWNWWSEADIDNHLFIMRVDRDNEAFDLIGHLSDNLGKPGEEIKSVRYDGETAYIVTFELTDPLYVIDLQDPSSPTIVGEILQPGFDTYQHVWGDNRLIGIGYDADENGFVTGMKISAYNVSSGEEEPLQTYNIFSYDYSSGTSWSYGFSEALYNHKALLVSVERGYLGFAVQAYEYGYVESSGSGGSWYAIYHSYYYLFKIDFANKNPIADPIIIEHPSSNDYYVGVDRGLMIDDYVYTLSDQMVITYSLADAQILEPHLVF